jgi:hypothetical protein
MAPEHEVVQRLARSSGMPAREVSTLVEFGVISIDAAPSESELVRRLRRARRLRRDLELPLDVVAMMMRLLDRIDELEARF